MLALRIDSTTQSVREAVTRAVAALDAAGLDAHVRDIAEIVLAEALNNVVHHAYGGRPGGGIRLCLSIAPEGVHVDIADSGGPMPGLCLPPGTPPVVEDLPEGGFGWYLIRTLTCDLAYSREDGENRLRFRLAPTPAICSP